MGVKDELIEQKRNRSGSKGGKRGSVNNASRLAGLQSAKATTGTADWGSVDPRFIAAVVSAATLAGMICSFKLARDGGAYGLELYDNGESAKLWFNQDADIEAELDQVLHYLGSLQ